MKDEKKSYKVRCTDGSVEEYSYKNIFETVKSYLEKQGRFPSAAEVDNNIPYFLSHMKKVVVDEYTKEYDEAHQKATAEAK